MGARGSPITVVVTGVTRGLGRAMVDEFIRAGHFVLGCGRTRSEIDKLTFQYRGSGDFQTVDVASDQDVKVWASHIANRWGTPDLILNNAAVINKKAPLWEVEARELSDEIDINI